MLKGYVKKYRFVNYLSDEKFCLQKRVVNIIVLLDETKEHRTRMVENHTYACIYMISLKHYNLILKTNQFTRLGSLENNFHNFFCLQKPSAT